LLSQKKPTYSDRQSRPWALHQARHWQQAELVPNVSGFVLSPSAKNLRFAATFSEEIASKLFR
jgi:hypothetical protein